MLNEVSLGDKFRDIQNIIHQKELPINLKRLEYVWKRWQELGLDLEILTRFISGITYYSYERFKESVKEIFNAIDAHTEGREFILVTIHFDGEPNSTEMMAHIVQLKYGDKVKAIINQDDLNNNRFEAGASDEFPLNHTNHSDEKVVFIDDWSLSGRNSQLGGVMSELVNNDRNEVVALHNQDILIATVGLTQSSEEYIIDMGFKYYTPNPIIRPAAIVSSLKEMDDFISKIPEDLKTTPEGVDYILSNFIFMYSVVSFYKVPDNFNGLFRRSHYENKDAYIPDKLKDLWLINDTEEVDVEPRIYPFYKEMGEGECNKVLLQLIN